MSGGGFADELPPAGLAAQGLAMRRALLADLVQLSDRHLLTTVDPRIRADLPAGVEAVAVPPGGFREIFAEVARAAGSVWLIAPESGGRLAELAALAERLGAMVVGPGPTAIRAASDKLALCRRLEEAGLLLPRTWPGGDTESAVREAGFPLVVKPNTGAGCSGVTLVRDRSGLADALAAAAAVGSPPIVQEYVPGVPASASVLCAEGRARALGLNGQTVVAGRPFAYLGGRSPLEHPQRRGALRAACRTCELVPGLRGYVGVDLVLSARGPVVIELNPRLTTAYIGLRAAVDRNLAGLILAAAEGRLVRRSPTIRRAVCFRANGRVASL
ncbi:MAG: ATP-grasp domain-containing protein [Gemmatimonadota bacterium]